MNNAFITCIYNNLYRHAQADGTILKGRNYRDQRYFESLVVIAKTGVPIYCYTGSNDYDKLTDILNKEGITNVKLILKELIDVPYHARIQELKTKYPEKYSPEADLFWDQRCPELMLGKFVMIDELMEAHPEIDNLFWIDAGLSHNDVVSSPKYCLSADLKANRTERNVCLFTPRFVDKLVEWIEGRILLIEPTLPHNTPIPAKYNKNPYTNHNGAIGGLFGGPTAYMKHMCKEFFYKTDRLLEDELIYGEENIMFAVYTDYPEMFKTYAFATWYHEGWGDWHDPKAVNFSNFFDEVLQNDLYIDDTIFVTMAFGEKYRKLSKVFVDTFLQYAPDFRLMLVTDEPSFYEEYVGRIIVKQLDLYDPSLDNAQRTFPYNVKCKVIKMARDFFFGVDKIVYLDGDCFFVNPVKKEYFQTTPSEHNDCLWNDCGIKPGLNVVLGSNLKSVVNNAVLAKVNIIAKEPNEFDLNSFRECALIFKITDNYAFTKFLKEWELISEEIDNHKLVHIAECNDITIACKRANLPVNDLLKYGLYELRDCIYTTVKNETIRAIL